MKLTIMLFLSLIVQPAFAREFIIGGQEVNMHDPAQSSTVGIYSQAPNSKMGSLCTGTLIKDDIALTAAHCIPSGGVKPVVIFNPDLHAANPTVERAEAVAVNPQWRANAGKGMDQGDIALVKFGGGIPSGYQKATVAASDSAIKTGQTVTLAGYGINNAQTKTGAGRLRKADVKISDSRPGKTEMILDQTHGRGACHGDSGGPAYINKNGKMILAGVTNRGYPNSAPDDCAHKVVYTKVPAYRSWIQKNEKKLESESQRDVPMFDLRRKKISHRNQMHAIKSQQSRRVARTTPKVRRAAFRTVHRKYK